MPNGYQLVAVSHIDRDDPVSFQWRVVFSEPRLFHDTVLRRTEKEFSLFEIAGLDHRANLLARSEGQQVDDCASLCLTRAKRKLVYLQPVNLADRGEEKNVVMSGRD